MRVFVSNHRSGVCHYLADVFQYHGVVLDDGLDVDHEDLVAMKHLQ